MEAANMKYAFGLALLRKLCQQEKKNFVFSPLSLGTAFAMLTAGLKGETKTELLGVLGCANETELHDMYAALVANKDMPLKMANKYLAQHNLEVHADFDKLLRSKYESEVQLVDFTKDARKVEGEVNLWVAGKTNDMIKKLLAEDTLTPDTVMVLLNAVYFKGTWLSEFDPIPHKMDFFLRDGSTVQKDFMSKKSKKFGYHETAKLRFVRIPYKEAGCYMIVAIPVSEGDHIDELISELQPADMAAVCEGLNSYHGADVVLTMPKFKIEYNFGTVKDNLQALGVNKIFKAGEGDFSNMFTTVPRPLYVSDAVHQSVIEVDEKGTKAAAATAVVVRARCLVVSDEVFVLVERGFYFAVHNGKDNVCLFQGIHNL